MCLVDTIAPVTFIDPFVYRLDLTILRNSIFTPHKSSNTILSFASLSSTIGCKMTKRIIHKSPYFRRSKLIKFQSARSSFSSKTHESLISIRSSIGFTVQNTPKYLIVGYYTSLFTKIVQNHPFSSKSHR